MANGAMQFAGRSARPDHRRNAKSGCWHCNRRTVRAYLADYWRVKRAKPESLDDHAQQASPPARGRIGLRPANRRPRTGASSGSSHTTILDTPIHHRLRDHHDLVLAIGVRSLFAG